MAQYALEFHEGWEACFAKFDAPVRKRVMKKILQLQYDFPARHLKQGLPFYVLEAGQYRICYIANEREGKKTLYFAGDHKQYERWLGI